MNLLDMTLFTKIYGVPCYFPLNILIFVDYKLQTKPYYPVTSGCLTVLPITLKDQYEILKPDVQ